MVRVSVLVVVLVLGAVLVTMVFVLVLYEVLGICKVTWHFDQTSLSR